MSHLKTREKSNPSRENTRLGGSGLQGTCVCEEDGAESGEEGGEEKRQEVRSEGSGVVHVSLDFAETCVKWGPIGRSQTPEW